MKVNWEDSAKYIATAAGLWKVGQWTYKKVILPIIIFFKGYDKLKEDVNAIRVELEKYGLIESKQEFKFELADAALFECDESGKCISANIALCNMFETTKEQMMGMGWLNYIKQSEESKERYMVALQYDNEITDEYTIITARTKAEKKATYTALINRDNKGKIINIMGKVY